MVGRTDWQREGYKDPEARGSVAGMRKERKCGWASGKGLGEGRRRCWVAGPGLRRCSAFPSFSCSGVTPPPGITQSWVQVRASLTHSRSWALGRSVCFHHRQPVPLLGGLQRDARSHIPSDSIRREQRDSTWNLPWMSLPFPPESGRKVIL